MIKSYIAKILLLALILIFIPCNVVFLANETTSERYNYAKCLYKMGLYDGTSSYYFGPNLDELVTREQLIYMLTKISGREHEALALTSSEATEILRQYKDYNDILSSKQKFIAYAIMNEIIAPNTQEKVIPKGYVTGQEFCFVILKLMGYEIDYSEYPVAAALLVDKGGMTPCNMLKLNNKLLTNGDFVEMAYNSLSAKCPDGKTLIAVLIEKGIVNEQVAIESGLYIQEKALKVIENYLQQINEVLGKDKENNEFPNELKSLFNKIKYEFEKINDNYYIRHYSKVLKDLENQINSVEEEFYSKKNEQDTLLLETLDIIEESKDLELSNYEGIVRFKELIDRVKENILLLNKNEEYYRIEKWIEESSALQKEKQITYQLELLKNSVNNNELPSIKEIVEAHQFLETIKAEESTLLEPKVKHKIYKIIDELDEELKRLKWALTPLEVIDVLSSGNKAIDVVFSKEIDHKSLEDTIIVTPVPYNKLILTEDRRTLTIFLNNPVEQSTELYVFLHGIKDDYGNKLEKYVKYVRSVDAALPKVNAFRVVNKNRIEIEFNEPINIPEILIYDLSSGNYPAGIEFTIDQKNITAIITVDDTETTIQIELLNDLEEGHHTISISGIEDFAGFMMEKVEFEFEVISDVDPPKLIDVIIKDNDCLQLIFNERVFINNTNILVIRRDNVVLPLSDIKAYENTISVYLSAPIDTGSIDGYTIVIYNLKDDTGNILSESVRVNQNIN